MKISKKKILIIAITVLAIGGIGFGGFMLGRSGAKAGVVEKSVNEEIAGDVGADKAEAPPAAQGGHGEGHGSQGGTDLAVADTKKNLIFKFEPFTVNLFDPRARTYLQVDIQVEAKSAETCKRLAESEIPLRDATINLLTSKTKEEVSPPEGRERLKRELLARYEGLLGPNVVNNIYFTSFLTQ